MATVNKNAGVVVARIVGRDPIMDQVAGKLLAKAVGRASRHVKTGSYIRSLKIANVPGKKGVRDRLVYSDDPAALSIEYGHAQRRRGDHGRNSADFVFVPGQFILSGAIREMPGSFSSSFGKVK